MRRRGFIHGALCAAAAGTLPGCAPSQLPQLQLGAGAPAFVERKDVADGAVELILNAVDVWNSEGVGAPEEFTVDGKTMIFRLRSGSFFEQSWMRAGLFWHSRQKKIMLTTVVLGPPAKIRKLRLNVGEDYTNALPAKNFQFTPAKRATDKDLSAQAFPIKPSFIYAVGKATAATLTLSTDRGQLRGDLLAVPDKSDAALRGSVKFLFSEFAEQQRRIAAAG